jgi:hypothetical protein
MKVTAPVVTIENNVARIEVVGRCDARNCIERAKFMVGTNNYCAFHVVAAQRLQDSVKA